MNILNAVNLGIGVGNAFVGLIDFVSGLVDDDRDVWRSGVQGMVAGGLQAYAGYSGQALPSVDQVGWPSGPPSLICGEPTQMVPAGPAEIMPRSMPLPAAAPADQLGWPPFPVQQPQIIVIPAPSQSPPYPARPIAMLPMHPSPPHNPVRW